MIGAVNSVEAVITSIQGLSGSPEDLSALHDLLRGAQDSLRAEPGVNFSTLDQLDASKHSLGYLYFL
jgi:COP9 signalosome complex subunit 3